MTEFEKWLLANDQIIQRYLAQGLILTYQKSQSNWQILPQENPQIAFDFYTSPCDTVLERREGTND